MGLIKWLFGGGSKQVVTVAKDIGGIFRPNAEASAARSHDYNSAALAQYGAEFQSKANRTWFDSLADGLNRLARPIITFFILGVIPAVLVWPQETSLSFAALALLPTGYWALVSIIIGFYYGGRMQIKAQDFEKSVVDAVARSPKVFENIERLRDHLSPKAASDESVEIALDISANLPATDNQAVLDWRQSFG